MSKQGLSVIKFPVKLQKHLQKVEKIKVAKERKTHLANIQGGNKAHPIITCRDKKLNFYQGQTYSNNVPLASKSWFSSMSAGDYFTIHGSGIIPAFSAPTENEEVQTFEDLGLDPLICNSFKRIGFERPTNIQTMAIPSILQGSNTIISSETGNGKTYTYLAPLIHDMIRLRNSKKNDSEPFNTEDMINAPKALIILPGRELVEQTANMAKKICGDLDINVNILVGGHTKRLMTHPKALNPDILIASFGALSKLVSTSIYKIHLVRHVVLDEADTLLDDSFNAKVCRFLSKFIFNGAPDDEHLQTNEASTGTQLTLVGATFSNDVKKTLSNIVEVGSLVQVTTPFLHRILPHVTQEFRRINNTDVAEKLLRMVQVNYKNKIPTAIFSNTSERSNWASLFLNGNGCPCVNYNASVPRIIRQKLLRDFQENKLILSSTDLGSRGINTVKVGQVINLDFPKFMVDYIHRCGRTGRVGSLNLKHCKVINFIKKGDIPLVNKIEYSVRNQQLLPDIETNVKRKLSEMHSNDEQQGPVLETRAQ